MKIFLLIILLIFFLPIPFKFIIHYSKENYYIRLYKFTLLKKEIKKKVIENEERREDNKEPTKPKKEKRLKKFFKRSYNPRKIIKALDKNRFKPTMRIDGRFDYSLNDAALTAISYGVISSLMPSLLRLIKIIFKTKKIKLPISPQFKDEFIVNFDIKSIIFLSLAQIIYMLFLILKGSVAHKEVNNND